MSKGALVGVFGGTFDPIHLGHLAAVADAVALLELQCVLFVPNRQPPHKTGQPVSSVDQRVAMVRRAIEGNSAFQLSDVELWREGPSFTLDTMRRLARERPGDRLIFLTGCDSLPHLHSWHQPERLLEEFEVVVMERPTGEPLDWPSMERRFPGLRERVKMIKVARLEISGQDIRERVRDGRPYRYFLPEEVFRYVREGRLYL